MIPFSKMSLLSGTPSRKMRGDHASHHLVISGPQLNVPPEIMGSKESAGIASPLLCAMNNRLMHAHLEVALVPVGFRFVNPALYEPGTNTPENIIRSAALQSDLSIFPQNLES
jgi:hypothetical protein